MSYKVYNIFMGIKILANFLYWSILYIKYTGTGTGPKKMTLPVQKICGKINGTIGFVDLPKTWE